MICGKFYYNCFKLNLNHDLSYIRYTKNEHCEVFANSFTYLDNIILSVYTDESLKVHFNITTVQCGLLDNHTLVD